MFKFIHGNCNLFEKKAFRNLFGGVYLVGFGPLGVPRKRRRFPLNIFLSTLVRALFYSKLFFFFKNTYFVLHFSPKRPKMSIFTLRFFSKNLKNLNFEVYPQNNFFFKNRIAGSFSTLKVCFIKVPSDSLKS